ncbi:MAG: type II toxin-antitoxin system RelE/ParE family toxin [Planctomycetia bacterium]|nr:type II toxin-antitoxin system RelE/ParE family toxin [Planctomycetia bacterium]
MRRFTISPAAELDTVAILLWTVDHFGVPAWERYESLLKHSIVDVAEDPLRAGSQARPDIGESVRTFHLLHSRRRVRSSADRVNKPRHFLLFRIEENGELTIARILHDSMDIGQFEV